MMMMVVNFIIFLYIAAEKSQKLHCNEMLLSATREGDYIRVKELV